MKIIKRISALVLTLCLTLSFAGCHKKNETAVTVDGLKFTSAYYMCALINSDSEAKTKVDETLKDDEKSGEVDYYSKKIDGKKYVEWVEDNALESIKKIAAYKLLCKENKLVLEKDVVANAESYVQYYWSQGMSQYFEPNGVSSKTYLEYQKDTYYADRYFEFVYGKDGEKEIEANKVKTAIYDNFVIANMLQASYTAEMTDDQKTELKTKLDGYVTDLQNGIKTYEQVYNDYNGITEPQAEETTSDEPQPKDKYATVLGAEGTSYQNDQYETVKKMGIGEVKLIEMENSAGYILAVKQDIAADEYYIDNLDMPARYVLAEEDYEKLINDYVKKLDVKVSKYAVGQFKVKKIKQPEFS